MPQGNAELLEVGFGQLAEDSRVDFVLAKRCLISLEAKIAQPPPDIHELVPLAHPA